MIQPNPQPKKAIAVAQDVLAWLERFHFSTGCYAWGRANLDPGVPLGDMGPHVEQAVTECRVCLLGACLLVKARLFDAVPLSSLFHPQQGVWSTGWTEVLEGLGDIFSKQQMELMESAFERAKMFRPSTYEVEDIPVIEAAITYAGPIGNCPPHVQRVALVMQNVIANGGNFDPLKRPVTENVL